MKKHRELIYPVFLEASMYCIDKYWKNVFEDLAYGIPPLNMYVSRDYLICKMPKREFTVYLKFSDDPKTIYDKLYTIFSERMGMYSPFGNCINNSAVTSSISKWSEIKAHKSIRDVMICEYVINMTQQYNLDSDQAIKLEMLIQLLIVLKIIGDQEIQIVHGHIIHIEGISYCENKFMWLHRFTSPFSLKGTTTSDDSMSQAESFLPNVYTKYSIHRYIVRSDLQELCDRYVTQLEKSCMHMTPSKLSTLASKMLASS